MRTMGVSPGFPKYLAGRLRYKGKTRLNGITPIIVKGDFISADQNEFERHQK